MPDLESGRILWKDLLQTLGGEAVVIGADLRVLYVNLPVLERTGLSSADVIGQPCCGVLYGKQGTCDDADGDCPARSVVETGRPVSVVRRQLQEEGYRTYVEVTGLPILADDGSLLAVLCLPRQLGLEETYQRIFDSIREGVAVISPSGRLVDVNAGLCRILGYSKAELAGKSVMDFVGRKMAESWAEVQSGRESVELRLPRRDGAVIDVEISVSSLRLGPVTLFVAFVVDVSKRKDWESTIARQAQALAESAAQYRALFDSSGDVLVVLNNDMTIAMVNRRFEEASGYSRSEVEGRVSFLDFIPESDKDEVATIHRQRRLSPEDAPDRHTRWILEKEGRRWLAEISGVIIPGTQQSLLDLRDVTEAHKLQEEVLKRNHELATLVSVTTEMVSTLDLQTVLDRTLAIVCNQIEASYGLLCTLDEDQQELRTAAFRGAGVSHAQRVWKMGEGIIGWVAEHRKPVVWDDVRADPRLAEGDSHTNGTHSAVAVPLKVRDKLLGVVAAVSKDKEALSGEYLSVLTAYAAQASLAIENALLYQEVKGQALTDQLTGLYNRRFFDTRFKDELRRAQRYSHELSLLFADVNQLKVVNDEYGHLQGDVLLSHVAGLLGHVLRGTDIAVRYGGDEFVAILPETGTEEAAAVAERIIQGVTPCPLLSGGSIPWSISIGVASLPTKSGYEEDLIRLADQAAYAAKRTGLGWAISEAQ